MVIPTSTVIASVASEIVRETVLREGHAAAFVPRFFFLFLSSLAEAWREAVFVGLWLFPCLETE